MLVILFDCHKAYPKIVVLQDLNYVSNIIRLLQSLGARPSKCGLLY